MKPEYPRFALVQWPDAAIAPCCVTLESLDDAVRRGAVVIGREDDVLAEPSREDA